MKLKRIRFNMWKALSRRSRLGIKGQKAVLVAKSREKYSEDFNEHITWFYKLFISNNYLYEFWDSFARWRDL